MVSEGQKSDSQTVKPEDALRNKYAQLKAKKLAAQQKSGAAGAAAGGSSLPSPASAAASSSSAAASSSVSSSASLKEKFEAQDGKKRKLEREPETVKASSLTRDVIQAVQSSTKRGNADPAISPEVKKAKVMNMIPKRQTPISSKPPEREGKVPGSDASDSGSPWSKAGNASSGNSGFTSGLPQEFQGKLQTLVDQQLMTSEEVEGIKQCIRSEQDDTASKALEQFLKSNMEDIKNKVGYFHAMLRKAKDGRGRMPFKEGENETPGSSKLICPEEERVFQDMSLNEGRMIEKEIRLDNISCSLPPPESLFCEEENMDPEMMAIKSNLMDSVDKLKSLDAVTRNKNALMGRLLLVLKSAKPELGSNWWAQYFEIFNSYSVIPNSCQNEEKLKSLHLFECPIAGGGFAASVSAFNHFLKLKHSNFSWDWTGHTGQEWEMRCKVGKNENSRSEEERFIRNTLDHWVFSKEGHDVTIDQSTIDALWKRTQGRGTCHIVVADSGNKKAEDFHELPSRPSTRLFLSQTIAGLSSLTQGGTFILRMWQLYEKENAALVFLLNSVFAESIVCRPSTVQSPCGHVFLVCLGFKGISQLHLDALSKAVADEAEGGTSRMTMIPRSFLPSSWVQQIRTCVEFFSNVQVAAINRELDLNNNPPQYMGEIYKVRDRAAQQWRVRYNCRPLSSVQDRLTTDMGITHPNMSSAGGRHWFAIRGRFSQSFAVRA
uniref:Ribosomal RNA methyltransferase FtsJ domain-containing protein n=1 Tax=Hanusia phi TaxID=3032 RepID=A0A7S0EK09_9CRYP